MDASRSVFTLGVFACLGIAADAPPLREPRAISLAPLACQRATPAVIAVRGEGLADATSVFFEPPHPGLRASIAKVETEPPSEASIRAKRSFDLVHLRLELTADLPEGAYPLRIVTPRGFTNAMSIYVMGAPVEAEPAGTHDTVNGAVPLKVPGIVAGRIMQRGESDLYFFDVAAPGAQVTFETISGLPAPGAPGGNANGFDPSIAIYEASGSWFDPGRLNRLAFNDEPLWVLGRRTDAHLTHTFARAGRYFLRLEAFSGQGGADYTYVLRTRAGAVPPPSQTPAVKGWEERGFTRRLAPERLQQLAERGGEGAKKQPVIETYAPGATLRLPAAVEGVLAQPGETQRARFQVDKSMDLAIELETPDAAPPEFNPVVRLLNEQNEEVATSLFAGRGLCTGALNKGATSKVVVPLRDTGLYTIEVRDLTSDLAAANFRYRVVVRPQVPHLGNIAFSEDRVQMPPGGARTVRVAFDREEGYKGAVAVTAENLPPGVTALAAADYEEDRDPPASGGKRERYTPRVERLVVAFTADAGAAPMNAPTLVKLAARPIVNGKPGAVIASREIPLMVVTGKP